MTVYALPLVDARSNLTASNDLLESLALIMKRPTTLPGWMKRFLNVWNLENIKIVKRVIVSVIGATVLVIGIALVVLPGPAFIVIPVGLAILATEYAWARRWLKKARGMASNVLSSAERKPS